MQLERVGHDRLDKNKKALHTLMLFFADVTISNKIVSKRVNVVNSRCLQYC